MSISFQFLGGANEVGSVALELAMDGTRFLCDYGYSPAKPPRFPQRLTTTPDILLLSHAHVDHSGMVPALCGRSDVGILATPPTQMLAELLAHDSLKVAKNEGYGLPYDRQDVKFTRECFDISGFGGSREVNGVEVRLRSAGHIPGATMFEIDGSRKLLFTGDINTVDTNLVRGTKPRKCDILFVESTYAGREHPDRKDTEKRFLDSIEETVERGGRAVVPVFAVGRTQEVLMMLFRSDFDIWLDGMGQKVDMLLLEEPQFLRDPGLLRKAEGRANYVKGDYMRSKAAKGEVIVTTGGMLDGGPVLTYLRLLKEDKKSKVFLTGYQVEGTNGRLLAEKGLIDLGDGPEKIAPSVEFFDFSAHCGHSELVEFVKGCGPEKVVLFHGDDRAKLAADLGDFDVVIPRNMEKVRLHD